MDTPKDLPVIAFVSPQKWDNWLAKNHTLSNGIWMRIYKKASGKPSLTYAEALDEALCYGWIDGQKKSYDELSWIQRFTPRRARSEWSKINTGHVERLVQAGKMKPAGAKVVEAAKQDGRWDKAYHSSRTMTFPEDFLAALEKNKKAKAFFQTLNKSNLYAMAYRLQTAKRSETRQKRMKLFLDMLNKGQTFHLL